MAFESTDPRRFYGFSHFALGLNETTPLDAGHAPTDSRLRPDQLALERGDTEEAEKIKRDMAVQTILNVGSRSFSHFLNALERYALSLSLSPLSQMTRS